MAKNESPLALGNPTVQPSSNRRSLHSRTVSNSSRQHGHARDFDPILRNLSPTTTLRAFSETSYLAPRSSLHASLEDSTSAQRSLGTTAAQTCLDLRSWTRELEEWEWPGTFEVPTPAQKSQRMSTMTIGSLVSRDTSAVDQEGDMAEYWGSLPADTVKEYEQRSDEIVQQLDDINVEELKNFVLSAHDQAGSSSASMDDSIGAIGAATDLRRLDDFTAIITATILQALPYLSRLNRLLDTWTIRLAVLRLTPGFLKALAQARADLDHGWAAIAIAQSKDIESSPHAMFNRGTMIEMKSVIEHKVGGLGRQLDRLLDDLEGRSETVPESWIEDMETLEHQYAVWMVQAERRVLENDLKMNRWSRGSHTFVAAKGIANDHQNTPDSGQPMEGGEVHHDNGPTAPTTLLPSSRTHSGGTTLAETPSLENGTSMAFSHDARELARDDSQTIPSDQADPIVDRSPPRSSTTSRKSSRSRRHVPIILPYDGGDGQDYPTEGITGDLITRTGTPASDTKSAPVGPPTEAPTNSFAKKRALFAGDIERTQSLQRATKSPVRPFEHASNAFARLFKSEASTPERSRSSSLKSEISGRRSGSGKPENGVIWGGRAPPSPKKPPRRKTLDSTPQDGEKSAGRNENAVPVAADADAPPVPVLAPKSPRRSLQSPLKNRPQQDVPSEPVPEQSKAEPFPGFDFGPDWPLSPSESVKERDAALETHDTPMEAQVARMQAHTQGGGEGPGLSSPKKPLESDFFHRIFIDSLPGTPDERTLSPDIQHNTSDEPPAAFSGQNRSQSPYHQNAVPTIDPSMLENNPVHFYQSHPGPGADSASAKQSVQMLSPLDIPPDLSLSLPRNGADSPFTPGSVISDSYSPEIQDARASYFQMATPSLSRTTSAANGSPEYFRPLSIPTSSPMKLRNSSHGEDVIEEDGMIDMGHTRRASRISIESQPRLEVKSIDLPRRKSSSSAVDLEPQPLGSPLHSPTSRGDMSVFPIPPTIHEERPRSPVSPLPNSPDQHVLRHRTSNLSVVSDQTAPTPEKSALNAFMGKRRGLGIQSNNPPPAMRMTPKREADTFDRHVSEVLQTLPSSIRFRSGATTPQPRTAEPRVFSGPRPKNNPRVSSRTSMAPGGLTLAPADPSPNRRTPTANEPEVKLYHLTQAGREDPIKLFVRLVGEGERVMVRVGGGWADLADYLRQYAEHHGSRTVSGEIDVKSMSPPTAGGGIVDGNGSVHPALRRKASGTLSAEVARATRATSPLPTTPAIVHETETENEGEHGEGLDSPDLTLTTTPSRPFIPPRSPSRPSTSGSNRPSSKHSWSGINMAGPGTGPGSNSGKKELPEKQARWVEGMVESVQKASGGDKKNDAQKQKQQYFGELGKVGGTRRVVFRTASGAPGPGSGPEAGR